MREEEMEKKNNRAHKWIFDWQSVMMSFKITSRRIPGLRQCA